MARLSDWSLDGGHGRIDPLDSPLTTNLGLAPSKHTWAGTPLLPVVPVGLTGTAKGRTMPRLRTRSVVRQQLHGSCCLQYFNQTSLV